MRFEIQYQIDHFFTSFDKLKIRMSVDDLMYVSGMMHCDKLKVFDTKFVRIIIYRFSIPSYTT